MPKGVPKKWHSFCIDVPILPLGSKSPYIPLCKGGYRGISHNGGYTNRVSDQIPCHVTLRAIDPLSPQKYNGSI